MRPLQTIQYHSLDQAVYDNSQPDFDPQTLEVGYGSYSRSWGGTPTADTFLLAPSRSPRSPAFHPGSPSKFPLNSPPHYTARIPSRPRGKHPFASAFEVPSWKEILLHTALCLVSYPIILGITFIARNKSLFWSRFIVGVGCGFVGLYLGQSLLRLAKRHLEAAAWATVIHQSYSRNEPGLRLRDLAATSEDPTSAWTALRILWDRSMYSGTTRQSRKSYDRRPWSLVLFFFLFLVIVAGTAPFILGRLVLIESFLNHQSEYYEEVSIKGDSSDADIARAALLRPAFENYILTWTISPFSTHGGLPPVVSFNWNDDIVYFSETTVSQLLPNGSGFGTFSTETVDPSLSINPTGVDVGEEIFPGSVLRFPKWGIRIRCEKLPDPDVNLITMSPSNLTYVFTPHAVLESIFSAFNMEYPKASIKPLNFTKVVQPGDSYDATLNADNTAFGAAFYNNGVAHSFFSKPLSMGADGKGWISMEQVLVRLNNSYTPDGRFASKGNQTIPDVQGNPTWIGYDVGHTEKAVAGCRADVHGRVSTVQSRAEPCRTVTALPRRDTPHGTHGSARYARLCTSARQPATAFFLCPYDVAVCVELFEPWIVEVYNSSIGQPTTMRIVGPGNEVRSMDYPDYKEKLVSIPLSMTDSSANRQLNSSKLTDVYVTTHGNSVNQLLKDNGRDAYYVPSPTVVSYSNGNGPQGFTELSAPHFAQSRGLADASNMLPYFAGTGEIVTRRYADLILSDTRINPFYMAIYLAIIFVLGLVAALFVPRLPLDVPHRGFDAYSWMAAFHADELIEIGRPSGCRKNLELDEIAEQMGDLKFRYMPDLPVPRWSPK